MILVMHAGERWILDCVMTLEAMNVSVLSVHMKDLINDIGVISDVLARDTFVINGVLVDINSVSAVLHAGLIIPPEYFESYAKGDQEYVSAAWHSYLLYLFHKLPNVVNRMGHARSSISYFCFLRQYAIAKQFGFKVPNCKINTRGMQYVSGWLVREDLGLHNSFKATKSNKDAPVMIERVEGEYLFVHVIGDQLLASFSCDGQVKAGQISARMKLQCKALVQQFNLDIAQLVFIEETFYAISDMPDWQVCYLSASQVARLISQFLRALSNRAVCYIPVSLRPEIAGGSLTCN